MRSALIISKHPENSLKIRSAFGNGFRTTLVGHVTRALEVLAEDRHDLVFADVECLGAYEADTAGGHSLDALRQCHPAIETVVMVPQDQIRKAVDYVIAGARDYVTYPISVDEVRLVVGAISQSVLQKSELDYLRDQFWKTDAMDVLQTRSAAMQEVFKKIRSVASTKTTVMLTGETGTGKSVLAKLIHQHSNRQNAQFIYVHCGAIPDTLLESELFGHEKGAFTGAVRKKLGKFEIANGGTIFLDEIGTLTPPAQIKLLQVLQDGSFNRVGGEEVIRTNARVITATNENLKILSEKGQFRKDLYFRLNVFPIEIPPLLERIQDLPYLMELFLRRLNREHQKAIRSIHPQVIRGLTQYDWPGNVRELENLMERAYILENSAQLTPESFPRELFQDQSVTAVMPVNAHLPLADARRTAVADFERQYLKELLTRNAGKINASASEAQISTRQLNKLMRKYGIRKEEYKKQLGT